MTPSVAQDEFYMARALRLAERGRGRTSPNPLVGALVVDADGVIVGRGAHELAGGPHAEIHALREAGHRARGSTLYCTLEPCCHEGRTGPCAPRVIEAGIRRAVIATDDPNPLVAGRGRALLAAHGVEITAGVLEFAATRLNAPFFSVMQRGRPFVSMKVALSLDGRIAAGSGVRSTITGPESIRHAHRERAEVDAIAIGSGTLLVDDPVLTPRVAYRARPLTRVIFDRRLRTPPGASVFATLDAGPVIIVTREAAVRATPERARTLVQAGAMLEPVQGEGDLRCALVRLVDHGISSLIVEGGTILHRAFWNAGLVDRVQMYVAPRVLGDAGVPWLDEPVVGTSTTCERMARPLGEDTLIEAYVYRTD